MNNPAFELKDVFFSYQGVYPALRGIHMTVRRQEKIAVIGANGSGKSTLLHMLDGLIFPDQGIIRAFGADVLEHAFDEEEFSRNFRKKVGLVFQSPDVQLFCPTVREDIVFGPLQLGVDEREIRRRLAYLSELLDIGDVLDRSPHQLSIGEKRKVAIASTLAVDPEVLIMDEPTAGLDPFTTRHIIDIILQANENGKTIVTSTHDLHIVEEIADTVYVFGRDKSIARAAPPEEILADEKFLMENNLVHIHRHRHKGTVHVHPHLHAHQDHH